MTHRHAGGREMCESMAELDYHSLGHPPWACEISFFLFNISRLVIYQNSLALSSEPSLPPVNAKGRYGLPQTMRLTV